LILSDTGRERFGHLPGFGNPADGLAAPVVLRIHAVELT
jgi:hypothetical protein